jgi:hypothetical protein
LSIVSSPKKIQVPKELVDLIFNLNYLHLVMAGQLRAVEVYNRPAGLAYNQPPGTRSIVEDFWDDAIPRKVACVHHYWLPAAQGRAWRIGGCEVPEAKSVYWDGVMLYHTGATGF